MVFTGTLSGITRDFSNNKMIATFAIDEGNIERLAELMQTEKLSVEVEKYRDKRSLNANSYMWVLCQKIAEVIGSNKDSVYLEMLSQYGVFTHILVKPGMEKIVGEKWKLYKVLGEVLVNGVRSVQLQCYIGSHEYNTKEMSVLIDGIVYEAMNLGIDVLPKTEIDTMKSEWGK